MSIGNQTARLPPKKSASEQPGKDNLFRKTLSQDTKASAYFTLVRPNLEYYSNVWSPYTDQAKDKIEMVQRRAARYATNRYRNKSSVTDMLEDLSWETLETRRAKSQVTMMYKITQDTRYKIQETLFNVGYSKTVNISYKLFFRQT